MKLTGGLRTLADGLDHPEGVCWSPRSGAVYAGVRRRPLAAGARLVQRMGDQGD
jgi:hypothetical protein